jgi:hypothetical protein
MQKIITEQDELLKTDERTIDVASADKNLKTSK